MGAIRRLEARSKLYVRNQLGFIQLDRYLALLRRTCSQSRVGRSYRVG